MTPSFHRLSRPGYDGPCWRGYFPAMPARRQLPANPKQAAAKGVLGYGYCPRIVSVTARATTRDRAYNHAPQRVSEPHPVGSAVWFSGDPSGL